MTNQIKYIYRVFLLFITLPTATLSAQEAIPVTIEQESDCYTLHRGGAPYYIKGAGGQEYLDRVKEYGGNSIRLWSTKDPQSSGKTVMEILDEADSLGLTVTLGLWVTQPRQNPTFYDDPAKVEAQLESFRQDVQKYRNHPALLMWAVGNEVHLSSSDTRVWDAVGNIAAMIKAEDPNHPVTTVTANINSTIVGHITSKAPDIDILGINAYGNELLTFPQKVRNSGWQKAYFMGEYGPTMHWQVSGTAWGAKFEPLNSEKAAIYSGAYSTFQGDNCLCQGSYVFKWGWKWERTYSWINLFTPEGLESEVVDVMHYHWKGEWPENRAPKSGHIRLNGKFPGGNDTLLAGTPYPAHAMISDPDDDELTCTWILYEEGTSQAGGGDAEPTPPRVDDFVVEYYNDSIIMQAPYYGGPFRLYLFVTDTAGNISISNYPFYVKIPEIIFEGDSLPPVADTYARGGTFAGNNYGSQAGMITKVADNESYTRESFMKFDVSGINTAIGEAYLHVYGTIVNSAVIEAWASDNTTWSETGLTWNNRPATQTLLDEVPIGNNSESYFTWDVSSHVAEAHRRGDTHVTLALKAKATTEKEVSWNSREAGINIPILGFVRSSETSNLEVTSLPLELSAGSTATITPEVLNVTGNAPTAIRYAITQPPTHGNLLRNSIVVSEGNIFKQEDINNGLLSYRHNGGEETSDSFTFDLSDPTGASLTGQLFNVSITPVSVDQNREAKITLHPNPARNTITLSRYNSLPMKVECVNMLGQVQNNFRQLSQLQFDVNSLAPGWYTIRVIEQDAILTLMFIKE
jgi:hypothetical protein